MPFTLSHPAAVLPLRRTGLPMAALVCGSMAPDLHMGVPGISDELTHAWEGVPSVDVLLGLALTVTWVYLLAPPARAAMPRWVRDRMTAVRAWHSRDWLLAVPAVLVGAVTHVGWDTFTHQKMWGGQHLPLLYEMHHGYPGYQWSQYLSSVLGLVAIASWAIWQLRRTVPRPAGAHPRVRSARVALLLPLALAVAVGGLFALLLAVNGWTSTDVMLSVAMRTMLVLGSLGCAVGSFLWRVMPRVGGPVRQA